LSPAAANNYPSPTVNSLRLPADLSGVAQAKSEAFCEGGSEPVVSVVEPSRQSQDGQFLLPILFLLIKYTLVVFLKGTFYNFRNKQIIAVPKNRSNR
jgi:hypothetical protein